MRTKHRTPPVPTPAPATEQPNRPISYTIYSADIQKMVVEKNGQEVGAWNDDDDAVMEEKKKGCDQPFSTRSQHTVRG